jgi:hypothetical protein
LVASFCPDYFNCTLQVHADELEKRISKVKVKVPSRCPSPPLSDHRDITINISLLPTSLSSMTSISSIVSLTNIKPPSSTAYEKIEWSTILSHSNTAYASLKYLQLSVMTSGMFLKEKQSLSNRLGYFHALTVFL